MRRMIRLMTVLVLAAATPATFADSTDSTANRSADDKQDVVQTKGTVETTDEGGGRGEMQTSSQAQLERLRAEQRAQDEAIQDYNHEQFLQETWTKP